MASKDPVLTPELLKILKIFGAASISLVLFFSFFDSYRADNTGEDKTFRMTSSSRLFFLNLRAIDYQREIRKDAGMTLFRHGGFSFDSDVPTVMLVLILNTPKDESYLYLEPQGTDWPLNILAVWGDNQKALDFNNGNKFDQFNQAEELHALVQKEVEFFLLVSGQKIPLWQTESEKEALKSTFEDYFRILNNQ